MSPPRLLPWIALLSLTACSSGHRYTDTSVDFGAIKTVAVLPFANLSKDGLAAERVREVYASRLLATGAVYVLPAGEVSRGVAKSSVANPTAPSREEVVKLGAALGSEAIVTGVVREYGEIRSGTTSANVISVSVQMFETATGKVIWSASATRGGIGFWERLLGGGGQPMNDITEDAVDDLLAKLLG